VVNAPGKDRGAGLGQVFERLEKEKASKTKEGETKQYDQDLLKLLDKFL